MFFSPKCYQSDIFNYVQVVDPWGKILAECDNTKGTDIAIVQLDMDVITSVRQNMPCFKHRRDDIYTLLPIEIVSSDGGFTEDFVFEKYPIPTETIFYESEHSIAFTNIRCVVKGRTY